MLADRGPYRDRFLMGDLRWTKNGRLIRRKATSDRCASLIRLLLIGTFLFACISASTDAAEINIGYLRRAEPKSTLSLIEMPAANDGVAGARLAIDDNNTTGTFLNQQFSLEDVRLVGSADAVAATSALVERGVSLMIVDLPADALLKAADAGAARKLLSFNVGAIDDRLREEDCRANVIHTAPTRSMLADALAQYLVWKQWRRWLLVVGSHAEDKLYGDALRRSAKRFGARIVQEKVFEDTGGARRTDSGVVQIQHQLPVFTQGARLRCARGRRRKRGFRVVFAVPDLGSEAGCGIRGPRANNLGRLARPVGRGTAAGPIYAEVLAANDLTRYAGVDRRAHDRRKRVTNAFSRPESHAGFPQRTRFRLGRVQRAAVDATRLESSTSSTHSSERRQNDRFSVSAGRISASGFRIGYARDRPSRKSMQAQIADDGKDQHREFSA